MVIEESEKGITLVALGVTIIVLIILTGVTIGTLTGEHGILDRSALQKKAYEEQTLNKQLEMNEIQSKVDKMNPKQGDLNSIISNTWTDPNTNTISNEITPAPVPDDWDLSKVDPIDDGKGGYVPLPGGYDYVEGNIDTGIVIQGPDGSQFVWVPVDDGILKIRSASVQAGVFSNYKDYYPADLRTSVNVYKGFYIGRYEASYDKTVNTLRKPIMIPSLRAIYNTAPSQHGDLFVAMYFSEAVNVSEKFALHTNTDSKVTSILTTGGMWDETLLYIEKVPNAKDTDVNCKDWGNYYDDTFSNTTSIGKSGQWEQTKAKNIYDIAANLHEFTYEYNTYSGSNLPCMRGGRYSTPAYSAPASFRTSVSTDYRSSETGFRVSLYIKP